MKHNNGFYVILSSIRELCIWLQKDKARYIEIFGMRPVKGEDRVIIDYIYKEEKES